MKDGATAGYRYFIFENANYISVTTRGSGNGKLTVKDGRFGEVVAEIKISPSKEWQEFSASLKISKGKKPLYFTYQGDGSIDFYNFTLYKN